VCTHAKGLIAADRINFNMWEISGRISYLAPSSGVKHSRKNSLLNLEDGIKIIKVFSPIVAQLDGLKNDIKFALK